MWKRANIPPVNDVSILLKDLLESFNRDNMHKKKGNTVETAHLEFQKALDEVPHERIIPGSGEMALL